MNPRLAGEPQAFRLLAAGSLALATVQTGAIAASLSGAGVGPWSARAVLVTALGVAVLAWRAWRPDAHARPRGRLHPAALVVATCAVIGYAMCWAVAWVKPDLSWDANAAHIPVVHFWTQASAIHWVTPDSVAWQGYTLTAWNSVPKGVHAVMFVLLQATGLARLINAYNLPWLPLGALGIYSLACQLRAGRPAALLAASLYLLVPVNLTQAPTAYVDGATTACFAALAAVTLRVFCAGASGGRVPGRDLLLLGALGGLAMSVKMTGVVFGPLAILLAVSGFLLRPGGGWRVHRATAARALVAACLVAALAGGYWYARNLAHTGNPVYPVGWGADSVLPGERLDDVLDRDTAVASGTAQWPQAARVVLAWAQGGTRWPASIRMADSREGGLGYVWIAGGLPATVFLGLCAGSRRFRRRFRVALPGPAFGVLVVLVVVTFLARPYNHWARHTLFLHVLGLPAFALVVSWARGRAAPLPWRRAVRVWAAACVAVALFEAAYCLAWTATRSYAGQPGWPAFARNPVRAAVSLTWHDPAGRLFPQLSGGLFEDILASGDAVSLGGPRHNLFPLVGQLCQPPGARRLLFPNPVSVDTTPEADAWLRENHVRFVVLERTGPPMPWLLMRAKRYERVGTLFHLIELDPSALDGREPR